MFRLPVILIGCAILFPVSSANAQFQSQFGKEWPTLFECLEHSADSGDWSGGKISYRFNKDKARTFTGTYSETYFNRLFRTKTRTIAFAGTWNLRKRAFSADEKKTLDVEIEKGFQAYILTLQFKKVTLEPPYQRDAKISTIFPSPSGGELSKKAVLFLDEMSAYVVPNLNVKSKSNPRFLNWIVIEDELAFFPKKTAIGQKAWTIGHKKDSDKPKS